MTDWKNPKGILDLDEGINKITPLWRQDNSQQTPIRNQDKRTQSRSWDVFISHATEDKKIVADPLAQALRNAGLSVWYDKFELRLGDRLRRSIDKGLSKSRFGIVILSPSFFKKHWPQLELDGLVQRETNEEKVILPIWYDITADEIKTHSPTLADRIAMNWEEGLETVASAILGIVLSDSVHSHNRIE